MQWFGSDTKKIQFQMYLSHEKASNLQVKAVIFNQERIQPVRLEGAISVLFGSQIP